MGDDDEGLSQLAAQIKEKLMQILLVVGVEAS